MIRRLARPEGTGRAVQPGKRSMGEFKYDLIVADKLREEGAQRAERAREQWLPRRPWVLRQRFDGSVFLVDADGMRIVFSPQVKKLIVERVNAGEPE